MKAATDLLTLLAGQVGSRVLGFLAFAYLARELSVAEYGWLETVVGMAAIGITAVEFGTGTVGIRDISVGANRTASVIRAVFSARVILAAVAVPTLVGLYGLAMNQAEVWLLLVLFGASLFAGVLKQDWLFQATDRMGTPAAGTFLKMAAFLGAVILFSPGDYGLAAAGWAEIFAMSLVALFFLVAQARVYKVGAPGLSFAEGASCLRRSAPLGLAGFTNTLGASLPILVAAAIGGAVEAGEFGAAQRIAYSLIAFSWIYYQNLYPLLARQVSASPEKARTLMRNSDVVTSWVSLAGCTALFLSAESLMTLTFGDQLAGASLEFKVLIWSVAITLASGSSRWLLIAQGAQMQVLWCQVAGAIVTLGVAAVATLAFGGVGTAIGVLAGALAIWATSFVLAVRQPAGHSVSQWILPMLAAFMVATAGAAVALSPWLEAVAGGVLVLGAGLFSRGVRLAFLDLAKSKSRV